MTPASWMARLSDDGVRRTLRLLRTRLLHCGGGASSAAFIVPEFRTGPQCGPGVFRCRLSSIGEALADVRRDVCVDGPAVDPARAPAQGDVLMALYTAACALPANGIALPRRQPKADGQGEGKPGGGNRGERKRSQ
jgi:hypothetical protein